MIKQLLIIVFMCFNSFVFAQTGGVTGSILDSGTQEALIGATVLVKGTNKGGIADLTGKYLINNVPTGTYTLQISYVGYQDLTQEVTITDGQVADVGAANLESTSVGLKEVQVFASIVDDRKTPIAVSAIGAKEIQERYSGADIADIVKSTPGVYSTEGAGGYGDNEVYIRGFDQSNVAFLINGVPVNDMENGRMFWSNFAGLSEITRQIQVQRGLGASKLAISSIGGTINMITKPADRREGGKLEYQMGTGSWNQRLRFTYNTGILDGGWAVSFQGSRTTTNSNLIGLSSSEQGSVYPGAFTDAWSYYLSVSKKINDQHSLMFWGFGAPVNRGTAWTIDESAREEFNIDDPNFNNALGVYKGDIYNARQNKVHKPLMALTHFWDIDNNTSLSTSFYASFAKVYSTQPRDSESSLFFPERFKSNAALTADNLINWDYLAERNQIDEDGNSRLRTVNFPNGDLNTPIYEGYESQYYLEARYNNHKWVGLITNFRKTMGDLSVTGGADLRYYRGIHYAQVHELFGGDFVVNQSRFGDDYNKLATSEIVREEEFPFPEISYGAIAKEGDRINYDYEGIVKWGALFGQVEYSYQNFTAFATLSGTLTNYKRIGNFWNGRPIYNDNSLGESETKSNNTYTAKAGVSYSPTNRHSFYVNGGRFTRPPFFRNVFTDARYSNELRDDLKVETVNSIEGGYGYTTSRIRVSANYYLTYWKDRTTPIDISSSDPNDAGTNASLAAGDEIPILLNGLISRHEGVELEFKFNATSSLELNGFLSYGDWKWDNNVNVETTFEAEGGEEITVTKNIDLKGFSVGASAQTTAGIGLHYSGIRNMYVGGRWNYADRIAVRYSPDDVADEFITPETIKSAFDDYSTVQLYMGRNFNFGEDTKGRISASVQNVFNTEFIRWSSYFFSQFQNAYGFPRTYTISLQIEF